jgi:hypothetical protein
LIIDCRLIVNRIFSTLAVLSNLGLLAAFWLGWNITDAAGVSAEAGRQVGHHFLTALGASIVALLVHAVSLTYFMGTGRWIEETSEAYRLGPDARQENIRLKYRTLPGMILCVLLIIGTGALGAIADPASQTQLPAAATIHFTLACVTLLTNVLVSWVEQRAIARNGRLVDEVLAEAQRLRGERNLQPV